jgi:response regulator of citrate/malate metabolism
LQQRPEEEKTILKVSLRPQNCTPEKQEEEKAMKDSTKKAQIKRFYECLKERPMTTKMAAEKLGIQRCNLTRYVAYLEKRNLITVVQEKPCEITKHQAKYYSTDRMYFQPETQSELFEPQTKSRVYDL